MFWGKRNVLRDPRTEKNVLQTINCDIEFPSTIVLLGRRTYFLFPFDEMIAKLLNIPIMYIQNSDAKLYYVSLSHAWQWTE